MINKVILIGNLVRDPELQSLSSGMKLCKITIATNKKTKDGQETMFIDVVAWDKQAEFVSMYFKKGKPLLVEGRLKLDTWLNKETGKQQSKHVIVAESVSFVSSDRPSNDAVSSYPDKQKSIAEHNAAQEFRNNLASNSLDNNDELPF